MNNYESRIADWFAEQITDPTLFLVDANVSKTGKASKVVLKVDGDEGITIDQCAEISRALAPFLDEQDWFSGAYNLEVTSPGIDFPLIPRQLPKHVGRTLKVQLKTGDKALKGKLLNAEDTRFLLAVPSKNKKQPDVERWIDWQEVKKAVTVVSFN